MSFVGLFGAVNNFKSDSTFASTMSTLFRTMLISSGLLDAVSSLKTISLSQVICLTWDAPPSLDITGVDPDIWYCVDITVDNITLGNSSVNISKFNFRMGDYNDTNTSVIYKFRVTPINGAGDGPQSAPVTGYFSGRELLMKL